MCYDHNKCRFQDYIGLLSKPSKTTILHKKARTELNKKTKHAFIFILRAIFVMIVTHGRIKTWIYPKNGMSQGGGGSAPLAPLAPTGLSWHSKWKGIVVTTMNNAAKKFTPKKRQKHLEIRH